MVRQKKKKYVLFILKPQIFTKIKSSFSERKKNIIFLRLEKFFERESCFTTNKQVFVGSLTFWGNGE